jgi:hypothetical protein
LKVIKNKHCPAWKYADILVRGIPQNSTGIKKPWAKGMGLHVMRELGSKSEGTRHNNLMAAVFWQLVIDKSNKLLNELLNYQNIFMRNIFLTSSYT